MHDLLSAIEHEDMQEKQPENTHVIDGVKAFDDLGVFNEITAQTESSETSEWEKECSTNHIALDLRR